MKKKLIIYSVCAALLLGIAAGTTVAWLKDKTEKVQNTFTVGDVDISMSETVGTVLKNTDSDGEIKNSTYKMVPGAELSKDPKVTVNAGSEACWLFVKAENSANFDDFMSFETDGGWTPLEGVTGVYYRSVDEQTAKAGMSFPVISDDTVTVKTSVTKEQLVSLTENTYPTLTFTAYAIQSDNLPDGTDALGAWNLIID
ncbi:MAG: TasA family protein [Clostridia bacterium]|nr:TasA family protein [Clostridia bacterium]